MGRHEVRQYLNVTCLCNPTCISNSNTSHQKWHISASHNPELLEWALTPKWMKLSEDNWQSTLIKKLHMIKEIRLFIHYVATSSILLPFQLVFPLILLISLSLASLLFFLFTPFSSLFSFISIHPSPITLPLSAFMPSSIFLFLKPSPNLS